MRNADRDLKIVLVMILAVALRQSSRSTPFVRLTLNGESGDPRPFGLGKEVWPAGKHTTPPISARRSTRSFPV